MAHGAGLAEMTREVLNVSVLKPKNTRWCAPLLHVWLHQTKYQNMYNV